MQAQSADGVIHDFPDGTDMSVVDRVMKSYVADSPQGSDATPAGGNTPRPAETTSNDPAANIGAALQKGAVEGFGQPMGQTILSPKAQEWMDAKQREGGVGGFLAGLGSTAAEDIGTVGGAIAGVPSALFRGAQAAVAQTGEELPKVSLGSAGEGRGGFGGYLRESLSSLADPQLAARDIAAGPEAFMGSPEMLAKAAEPKGGVFPTDRPYIPRSVDEGNLLLNVPRPTDMRITAREVQARDGVDIMEAWNRANAENTGRAVAKIGQATDINSAIDAFGKAAGEPGETPPLGDLFGQEPFAPEAAPGAAIPQPESAGAAASRDRTNPNVADLSTSDMKANRRVAEMDEILAPAKANDKMIHVPGSFPTLAEYSADPALSQTENLLRERKADQFVGEGKRLTENNKARVAEFDNNTIPDTTLNSMRRDRLERWTSASDDILPNAKPADLTPVETWVQEQLANPRIQENDAVRSVLENFQDRLTDDGGNLKTDPAAVWGIHDNLQNQLAKAKDPLSMTSAEKFAESQILEAKRRIDQAMNVATDNRFQTALDRYAEDSKAINAGVLFNDFRPSLTNMTGELQAQRFHNFVVSLAKERGDPGIDPSMDISDQGMRSMINIDNDLKRAKLIKFGAPSGSQTNLLGALAEKIGLNVAQRMVGRVPVVGPALETAAQLWNERKLNELTKKHLAEPEGGYIYPEPEEPSPPAAPNPPGRGGPSGTSGPGPLFNSPSPPPAPPAAPSPTPASAPAAASVPARATTGAGPGESVAFTPSGAAVAVRYTARDASNITASQLADGRTNPAYPAALQPRDRTRMASIDQINRIANRLNPELLGTSASTSEGAPIIGPDGAVESGNGRTMAIMQAYADGGPLADAYRQWVAAQGHDTSGMKNPVLVRERLGELDMPARARLAADMGASPIAAMSAPERAAADARAIPADILSMYQGGDVTLAKNAPFARAFADHVIPPSEHAGFMTADGAMSADGAIRMRNALTQHAYGSNSLVTSLAENADPDIKAFGGSLMDAAGDMAKLRGAIDSGTVPKASDIAPDIVAAAQLIQTAKRQRISLADAVGQRDAFSVLPEKTEDILQAAFGPDYAGRMSRARMADLLSAFAQEAQMQSGLFGANLTAGEMLAEARAKYGYGTKAGTKGRPGVPLGNGPGLDFNRP